MRARGTKSAKPKTVFIQLTDKGAASPHLAQVSKDDQIIWQSRGGDIQIVFPEEHPFDPSHGNGCIVKENSQTPPYPVAASKGKYKYNVITSKGTFEPGIVVKNSPRA